MSEQKKFFPYYLAEILFVVVLSIELLLLLVLLYPPQLGREIDFVRPYQPKPEWYFLWVFELLKYFPGNYAIVGAIIIPLFMAMTVVFIPFLDKSIGRKATTLVAFSVFILFCLLTIIGMI